MKKLEKAERISLLRALAEASNAFHDTLKKRGYSVSYGALDCFRTGSIRKLDVPPYNSHHLGDLTIVWNLNDKILEKG